MDNNPSDPNQGGGTGGGMPTDTNVPTGGTYTPPAPAEETPVTPAEGPVPESTPTTPEPGAGGEEPSGGAFTV